jgi:hypothetical protein
MAGLERGVELTHAVALLGDLLGVDGLVGAADQRCKRTVITVDQYMFKMANWHSNFGHDVRQTDDREIAFPLN